MLITSSEFSSYLSAKLLHLNRQTICGETGELGRMKTVLSLTLTMKYYKICKTHTYNNTREK